MRGFWTRKHPAAPAPAAPAAAASGEERPTAPQQRKPRILIAGEFSAGKTRLINGLLSASVLPSNVTATALPPVWLVRGEAAMLRVGPSGRGEPLASLTAVDIDRTQYCVVAHPAPVLATMDIIDTPGNADPNMSAEAWQRMLTFADAVVWCTNATQAWRQSEKAAWLAMPARLRQNATLLVTHADLLGSPTMAARVLQRVEREAGGLFDRVLMASLLEQADLDRIATHLRSLSARLRPEGAPNRLPADFAAARPVRSRAPEPGPAVAAPAAPVTPRRVTEASAAPVARPAPAAPQPPGGAPTHQAWVLPGDNVHQLVLPRRREAGEEMIAEANGATNLAVEAWNVSVPLQAQPAPVAISAAPPGSARALWADLCRSVDPDDADSILEAVEHLIARLDARPAPAVYNKTQTALVSGSAKPGPAADVCE